MLGMYLPTNKDEEQFPGSEKLLAGEVKTGMRKALKARGVDRSGGSNSYGCGAK